MQSLADYRQFLAQLEAATAAAWEIYKGKMACKAGCSSCCQDNFKIGLVEGLAVQQAVAALPEATRKTIDGNLSGESGMCPLLINDRCSVYEHRPTLCRIFGFPVATGGVTTTCELNFTEEQNQDEAFFAQAFDRDAIGEALSKIDRQFLQETGEDYPADQSPPKFLIRDILKG